MLKTVLILSVFGFASAQAATISCPNSFAQVMSCSNTKKTLADYKQPQVVVEDLILCRNQENGHFALVLNKSPQTGIPKTLFADGQGFGRNGFEVFTQNKEATNGVMLLPWQAPLFRVFVIDDNQQPAAASEFTCQ